jgi:hypothetical protein
MFKFNEIEIRLGSFVSEEFEGGAISHCHNGTMRKDHQCAPIVVMTAEAQPSACHRGSCSRP